MANNNIIFIQKHEQQFHHKDDNYNSAMLCLYDFKLLHKCGEGGGGVVWKAVRKNDGLICAIKILR